MEKTVAAVSNEDITKRRKELEGEFEKLNQGNVDKNNINYINFLINILSSIDTSDKSVDNLKKRINDATCKDILLEFKVEGSPM